MLWRCAFGTAGSRSVAGASLCLATVVVNAIPGAIMACLFHLYIWASLHFISKKQAGGWGAREEYAACCAVGWVR
jgi:hypothetical protein